MEFLLIFFINISYFVCCINLKINLAYKLRLVLYQVFIWKDPSPAVSPAIQLRCRITGFFTKGLAKGIEFVKPLGNFKDNPPFIKALIFSISSKPSGLISSFLFNFYTNF